MPDHRHEEPVYLLTIREVIQRVGVKRTTIDKRVKEGTFPAPVKLGDYQNAPVRWKSREIDVWIESLPRSTQMAR